jgi:hypothetical protein
MLTTQCVGDVSLWPFLSAISVRRSAAFPPGSAPPGLPLMLQLLEIGERTKVSEFVRVDHRPDGLHGAVGDLQLNTLINCPD